jgi:hypothetical protein
MLLPALSMHGLLLHAEQPTEERRATLHGTIVSKADDGGLSARVTIRNPAGDRFLSRDGINFDLRHAPSLVGHSARHFTTLGNRFEASLPPGSYLVTVEKGLEFEPLEVRLVLAPGETRQERFAISRWTDLKREGWISADHHVHRSLDELPSLLACEEIDIAFYQASWNAKPDFLKPALERIARVDRDGCLHLDDGRLIHLTGHEMESRSGSLFYHLPGRDAFPLPGLEQHTLENYARLAERTRHAGGAVEADKPIYRSTHLFVLQGLVDFVELANNHNMHDGYIPERATRLHRSLLGDYDEKELGYVQFVCDLYYHYLNVGQRLMPTAGSASMPIPNPFGFNRVYAQAGAGAPSMRGYLDAIRKGRSFVTNGPVLTMSIDGTPLGEELTIERPGVEITCDLRSLSPSVRLEVIHNGRVIEQWEDPAFDGRRARCTAAVDLPNGGWVAARAFETRPDGSLRFAHTAPMFVTRKGVPFRPQLRSVEALRLIHQTCRFNQPDATPADRQLFETIDRILDELARQSQP